eukprot:scaffold527_cov368-Prasinococcus_capsulatus_cf.AAC.11
MGLPAPRPHISDVGSSISGAHASPANCARPSGRRRAQSPSQQGCREARALGPILLRAASQSANRWRALRISCVVTASATDEFSPPRH